MAMLMRDLVDEMSRRLDNLEATLNNGQSSPTKMS